MVVYCGGLVMWCGVVVYGGMVVWWCGDVVWCCGVVWFGWVRVWWCCVVSCGGVVWRCVVWCGVVVCCGVVWFYDQASVNLFYLAHIYGVCFIYIIYNYNIKQQNYKKKLYINLENQKSINIICFIK